MTNAKGTARVKKAYRARPWRPAPLDLDATSRLDGLSLICHFCDEAQTSTAVDQRLVREVARRLEQILGPNGVPAERALGIARKLGRPPQRDKQIRLAEEVLKQRDQGVKVMQAILNVANSHACSESTVRHAYEEQRKRAIKRRGSLQAARKALKQHP